MRVVLERVLVSLVYFGSKVITPWGCRERKIVFSWLFNPLVDRHSRTGKRDRLKSTWV